MVLGRNKSSVEEVDSRNLGVCFLCIPFTVREVRDPNLN